MIMHSANANHTTIRSGPRQTLSLIQIRYGIGHRASKNSSRIRATLCVLKWR